MTTTHFRQLQNNVDEKRDQRKKFLEKAQNALKVSQNELEQKRISLHTSFESKGNESREYRTLNEITPQKVRPPRSPWQSNSFEKGPHRQKDLPYRGNMAHKENIEELLNGSLKFDERPDFYVRTNSFFNVGKMENTIDLSKIEDVWYLEDTRKFSRTSSPLKLLGGRQYSEKSEDNKGSFGNAKGHRKQLDSELGSLGEKLFELFHKEKKDVIEENNKNERKEEYNRRVKDTFNRTMKESEEFLSENNSSPGKESNILNERDISQSPYMEDRIMPEVAVKGLAVRAFHTGKLEDEDLLEDPNEDMYSQMNEIKLNFYNHDVEDLKPSIIASVLEHKEHGSNSIYEQSNGKQKKNDNEKELLSLKVEELENENKNLHRKLSKLEEMVKSWMPKENETTINNMQHYHTHHTPKLRTSTKAIVLQKEKENYDNKKEAVKKKNPPQLEQTTLIFDPPTNKANSTIELRDQINLLAKRVEELEKVNLKLVKTNKVLKCQSQQIDQQFINSLHNIKDNSGIQGENSADFWKNKCKILTSQYFHVIKTLKEDNEALKKQLNQEFKEFKHSVAGGLNQIQKRYKNKVEQLVEEFAHYKAQKNGELVEKDAFKKKSRASSVKTKHIDIKS